MSKPTHYRPAFVVIAKRSALSQLGSASARVKDINGQVIYYSDKSEAEEAAARYTAKAVSGKVTYSVQVEW